MKSNELLEMIHSGQITEGTKIDVLKESGEYITTIEYKENRLSWKTGTFDTKYLCNIKTEFKINENWKIKKLKSENLYAGERIENLESKVNEIIDYLKEKDIETLPF